MKPSQIRQRKKMRQRRVRAKLSGSAKRPRLCVFRSNSHLYAQLVDDINGHTLATISDLNVRSSKDEKPKEKAKQIGILIAEKAKKLGIQSAVFDRSGYLYHGQIKGLAEGAREGGLNF